MPGVTIAVVDGLSGSEVARQTSDTSGKVSFSFLRTCDKTSYLVRTQPPPGYRATTPGQVSGETSSSFGFVEEGTR